MTWGVGWPAQAWQDHTHLQLSEKLSVETLADDSGVSDDTEDPSDDVQYVCKILPADPHRQWQHPQVWVGMSAYCRQLRCIAYAFYWVIMAVILQRVLILKHAEDIHQIEVKSHGRRRRFCLPIFGKSTGILQLGSAVTNLCLI